MTEANLAQVIRKIDKETRGARKLLLQRDSSEKNTAILEELDSQNSAVKELAKGYAAVEADPEIIETMAYFASSTEEERQKLPKSVRENLEKTMANIPQSVTHPVKAAAYMIRTDPNTMDVIVPVTQKDRKSGFGKHLYDAAKEVIEGHERFVESYEFSAKYAAFRLNIRNKATASAIEDAIISAFVQKMPNSAPLIEFAHIKCEAFSPDKTGGVLYINDLLEKYKVSEPTLRARFVKAELKPVYDGRKRRVFSEADITALDKNFADNPVRRSNTPDYNDTSKWLDSEAAAEMLQLSNRSTVNYHVRLGHFDEFSVHKGKTFISVASIKKFRDVTFLRDNGVYRKRK